MLRLNLPAEVDATASKAQRSKTTGHLVLTMPKVNPGENALGLRVQARDAERKAEALGREKAAKQAARDGRHLSAQLLQAAGVAPGVPPQSTGALRRDRRAGRGESEDDEGDGEERAGEGEAGVIPPLERRGGGVSAAAPTGGAVRLKGLVPHRKGGLREAHNPDAFMRPVATTTKERPRDGNPEDGAAAVGEATAAAATALPPTPPPAWAASGGEEDGDEADEPPELC